MFLINHINLNFANKKLRFTLPINKSTVSLLKIFKKFGIISHFFIIKKTKKQLLVRIYLLYFSLKPLYTKIKIISKQSKKYFISKTALKYLSYYLGDSIILLSTSKGLINHFDAIKSNLSGQLVLLF